MEDRKIAESEKESSYRNSGSGAEIRARLSSILDPRFSILYPLQFAPSGAHSAAPRG